MWSEVTATSEQISIGEMVTIAVEIADGVTTQTETLKCSGEHPFWVIDGDGLFVRSAAEAIPADEAEPSFGGEFGRWIAARSLQRGDELRTFSGRRAVISRVRVTIEKSRLYNLRVNGLSEYAVGRDGIVVHNGGGVCPTGRLVEPIPKPASAG